MKEVLKADPVFRDIRTKQEKYRYSRDYYNELEKNYKMIATKVSFREMIDDAICELDKEKYKVEKKI